MRQYSVLNMTDGERTALLMFAMTLQLMSYLAWDAWVYYQPDYHGFVNLPIISLKIQVILVSILLCVGLTFLAWRQTRTKRFSRVLMLLAVWFYVFDMLIMGWFSGLLTMALGVVLAGATFVGVLLLPPRVVLLAAAFAIVMIVAMGVATIYFELPYAPIFQPLIIGHDLAYARFYFLSQFYFSIPYLLAIVLSAHLFLRDWRQRESIFKYTSERDGLTQLFNRKFGQEKLADALKDPSGQPVSVILVDLDFFKMINDTHGHLVGDRVLQSAATTLQAVLRQTDVVARFGGEEFLLVLSQTSHEAAM